MCNSKIDFGSFRIELFPGENHNDACLEPSKTRPDLWVFSAAFFAENVGCLVSLIGLFQ